MASKIICFAALVAVARAGVIAQPALAYATPAYAAHGYAAPAYAHAAYAAPAYAAHGYAAPAYAAHGYAAPAYAAAAYAPAAYAAPAYAAHGYAAPVAKVVSPLAYAAPVAKVINAEYDPNPQYSYAYDVQDALTGDSKSQHESRNGDVVQGSYSLTDADGLRRTVDYTADPHNGFNAVVRREPLAHVAKVVAAAPVAYAAPVAKYAAAPVAYAASPLAYAAPVAKYAAPLAYSAPAYAAPAYYH